MKNRLVSLFTLCAILLSGAFFTSCEDTATIPDPSFFGQVRVMNFAVCASAESYDVYLYPENGTADTIAKALGLAYGISTPYITNLGTNKGTGQNYKLIVRAAGAKTGDLINTTIAMKPNDKWSFVILSEGPDTKPEFKLIDDNSTISTSGDSAYFRFINTMPGGDPGQIIIRVDDPISGQNLTPAPVDYKNISNYLGFKTETDKTLTFYAIKASDNTVLGRLAGVSLEGGSYTTMTWGGNCRYRQQEEGILVRDDSNRIRLFGDTGIGNDLTVPVPSTMRINFVNAMVNNPNLPETDPRYATFHYDHLGVVIDNDTRYNFPNLAPFNVGPAPISGRTQDLGNGSMYYENKPIAFPLNDAVNVKGFKMDPAQPNVRGTLLFDYRAGERSLIKSDMITTLVAHDSIRLLRKITGKDTSYSVVPFDSARYQFVVPVPDVPKSDSATIVLVNALAPGAKLPVTTANIKYYLNDEQVTFTGNWSIKKFKTEHKAPGSITIKATLNTTPVEEFTTTYSSFEAGGIYEVFFVGSRNHVNPNMRPRFVILRVNPKP